MSRSTGEWIDSLPLKYREAARAELYGHPIGGGLCRVQCGREECSARLLADLLGTPEMLQKLQDAAMIAAAGGHVWMVPALIGIVKNLPQIKKSRVRKARYSNAPYAPEDNVPLNQA